MWWWLLTLSPIIGALIVVFGGAYYGWSRYEKYKYNQRLKAELKTTLGSIKYPSIRGSIKPLSDKVIRESEVYERRHRYSGGELTDTRKNS